MQVNGQFNVPAASCPEKSPGNHGRLVGPRACLDDLEERKISCP